MVSVALWAVIIRTIKTANWRDILKTAEITLWALLTILAMILAPTWAIVVLLIPLVTAVSGTTWWAIGLGLVIAIDLTLFLRRRSRRGQAPASTAQVEGEPDAASPD